MAKRGRKKKKKINTNVVVALMLIASILLAVLIYTESGTIGMALSPFLGGIMGYIKYILPIGVFIMAIYIAYQGDENSWNKRIIQFSAILLSISVIMNVYAIYQGDITIINRDFSNVLEQFYDLGTNGEGGGAVRSSTYNATNKLTWKSWNSNTCNRNNSCTLCINVWNRFSK